ncbi:MAG: hypothetical protein D6762_00360 [Candidatus Neomarinimicrobiota bacterium]|nr:MAG: hypothetical protein D6762_00360 [Candidatus Neomarinimicrobiota bacterium]
MIRWISVACLALSLLYSQGTYELTFWGIPCGTITYTEADGHLEFICQSSSWIDWLYPFHNTYQVSFDTTHFTMLEGSKTIRQGERKQSLHYRWDETARAVHYEDKGSVSRTEPVTTILTLLALTCHRPPDAFDAHWYPMEHEGALYRARFLRADRDTLTLGTEKVPCDHYRLDLEPVETSGKVLEHSDFFHEYITSPEMGKQLWVTTKSPKKILQAQINLSGITLTAKLLP